MAICAFGLLLPFRSAAQTSCVSQRDVAKMLAPVKEPSSVSLDVKLRDELLKLEAKGEDKAKNKAQLCAILGRVGWPNAALVGRDGQAAAFFLLKNSSSVELQKELLPNCCADGKRRSAAHKNGLLREVTRAKFTDNSSRSSAESFA